MHDPLYVEVTCRVLVVDLQKHQCGSTDEAPISYISGSWILCYCLGHRIRHKLIRPQVYISLLKFDFFFVFGSQLQVLLVVARADGVDFIVNAALIPITIATLILSAQFCKREKKKSLILMMVRILQLTCSARPQANQCCSFLC